MRVTLYEKYLAKSKIGEIYTNTENEDLKREILSVYSELLDTNDLKDKTVFGHKVYSIYPTIAIYTAFQKFGFTKEQVLQDIERVILATGNSTKNAFAKIGILPIFFALFKKMCYTSTKTSYVKPYFHMKWADCGKDKIAWECSKCHYHDEFVRYNCSELTKIFCRLDDVMYGSIPTAKWTRTKTIGDGDEICNFCFIKTKKSEVN